MSDPRYRYAHQQERKRLEPIVEAGQAFCVEPVCKVARAGGSRWIPPGSRWHLSHNPAGTAWTGPSHATCNESEAAIRGNKSRAKKRTRWRL